MSDLSVVLDKLGIQVPPRSHRGAMGREEFEQVYRRYFMADELSPTSLDRLYDIWTAFNADENKVRGYRSSLFSDGNVEGVFGTLWWEERQQGELEVKRPISERDLCLMYFSLVPPDGARRPRNYCPDDLLGYWRCVGTSDDGRRFATPDADRARTFMRDGRFEARGDLDAAGTIWCVHLTARGRLLWLFVRHSPAAKASRISFEGRILVLEDATNHRRITRWHREFPPIDS
jgi:hypothetical protein